MLGDILYLEILCTHVHPLLSVCLHMLYKYSLNHVYPAQCQRRRHMQILGKHNLPGRHHECPLCYIRTWYQLQRAACSVHLRAEIKLYRQPLPCVCELAHMGRNSCLHPSLPSMDA